MMKGIKGSAIALLLLCSTAVHGQNELDAARYSGTAPFSTARSMGVGGAFSAIGADFSATALNPAGLAVYRRSDLMFTPTLRTTSNNVSYLDYDSGLNSAQFGFSNIGYVHAARVEKWDRESRRRVEAESGLVSYSFAIGYNQLNNFKRRTAFDAYNSNNSITDNFAGQAFGQTFAEVLNSNTLPGMAYASGAIDTSGVDGNWVGAALGGEMNQMLDREETGRTNQWSVGFAGNFNDKVYAGISLGIEGTRYNVSSVFSENDFNDVHNTFANDSTPINSITYTDEYSTRGTGVNVAVGIIARPTDFLRVGVSFKSPTWTSMEDTYSTNITGTFDNDPNNYGYADPLDGFYTYNFTSPYRVTVGVAGIIGKFGFLSADFEYLDYTTAQFSSDVSPGSQFYYSYASENDAIQGLFSSAYNLRVGGEFRFGPGRFRLGYSNYGAVVQEEFREYVDYLTGSTEKITGGRQLFTGGLGIKGKNAYLDFAYAREYASTRQLFYTVQDPGASSPELIQKTTSNIFSMTIGFTF